MTRFRAVLALTVSIAGIAALRGQTAETAARVIVLVDDLHIDFRSSPRLRQFLLKRILPPLTGHVIGLVTTGYSSISVAPTTDMATLVAALGRVTGGGLRPQDVVQQSQGATSERNARGRIAVATARDVIEAMPVPAGGTVMIYVSGGYGYVDLANDLADLVAAAQHANTRIYTFDSRAIFDSPTLGPDPSRERAWTAYVLEAQDSLRMLAAETGGQFVSAVWDVDTVLSEVGRELKSDGR